MNKEEWGELKSDVKHIINKLEEVCPDIKKNTEFRQQSKAIIGAFFVIITSFGGLIGYIWSKIRLK